MNQKNKDDFEDMESVPEDYSVDLYTMPEMFRKKWIEAIVRPNILINPINEPKDSEEAA